MYIYKMYIYKCINVIMYRRSILSAPSVLLTYLLVSLLIKFKILKRQCWNRLIWLVFCSVNYGTQFCMMPTHLKYLKCLTCYKILICSFFSPIHSYFSFLFGRNLEGVLSFSSFFSHKRAQDFLLVSTFIFFPMPFPRPMQT